MSTDDTSGKTIAQRNKAMNRVRDLVSAGDFPSQLREEIQHLNKDERQDLLQNAGFRSGGKIIIS